MAIRSPAASSIDSSPRQRTAGVGQRLWNVSDALRMRRAAARRAIATTTGYPPGNDHASAASACRGNRACGRRADRRHKRRDQRDDLDDADRLTSPARLERFLQPWPDRRGGDECVSHQARGEHPRAGFGRLPDERRQDQDQQRVGFHIEPGAEGSRRPRPPRDPSVHPVKGRRHRRDDHDRRRVNGDDGISMAARTAVGPHGRPSPSRQDRRTRSDDRTMTRTQRWQRTQSAEAQRRRAQRRRPGLLDNGSRRWRDSPRGAG